MPPTKDEITLLTIYGDVHYFFDDPDSFPTHHRFDKGSYIYIYLNPKTNRDVWKLLIDQERSIKMLW